MKIDIHESHYKDQRAISIESQVLAARFLPAVGANLCSLVYKPSGLELMVQRPGETYRVAPYDGSYVEEGECAGLDDMFPSIDRCFYERYPWRGTAIPDHGEVWSLPWDCQVEGQAVHFSTHGVRFPYRLERWVSFRDAGVLCIAYRLTNLSAFDFDFLWAAHPMFILEEGARLILPEGVDKALIAFALTDSLGGYGDEFDWPVATLRDGGTRDLRLIQPKATRGFVKYYIKGRMPEGWCALTYPRSGLTLGLSFPVDKVPYLSVLPNEGGWQDLYNIFLEPATASFDRIDAARLRGEFATVAPRSTYEWHLNIALAPGTNPTRITPEGKIVCQQYLSNGCIQS